MKLCERTVLVDLIREQVAQERNVYPRCDVVGRGDGIDASDLRGGKRLVYFTTSGQFLHGVRLGRYPKETQGIKYKKVPSSEITGNLKGYYQSYLA